MQVSPSLDMTVGRYGVWRGGIAALLAVAALAVAAWWLGAPRPLPAPHLLGLLASAVCLLATATSAWPRMPVRLRWDGRHWWIAPGAEPDRLSPVEAVVAVDLGRWMLLRLRPQGAARWRRSHWLPVQRRGHEAHWHALRCAVYSPRPAPGGPPAAEP